MDTRNGTMLSVAASRNRHSQEEILTEEDLYDILCYLINSTHRWKKLGIALGLTPSLLERVEGSETDMEAKLSKMITEWLKKNYAVTKFSEPTWSRLAEAVGDPIGGADKRLAKKIAREHRVSSTAERRYCSRNPPALQPPRPSPSCWCWRNGQSDGSIVVEQTVQAPNSLQSSPSLSRNTYVRTSSRSEASADLVPGYNPSKLLPPNTSGYHGTITSRQAEERLRSTGRNCFLIRYSSNKTSYVLSVLSERERGRHLIRHYKMVVDKLHEGYAIEGTGVKFESLHKMLWYYHNNPLDPDVSGIGVECNEGRTLVLSRNNHTSLLSSISSRSSSSYMETPV